MAKPQLANAKTIREATMFLVGAVAFLNEVFVGGQERPFIIAACLALMGLPFVLRGEDQLRSGKDDNEK